MNKWRKFLAVAVVLLAVLLFGYAFYSEHSFSKEEEGGVEVLTEWTLEAGGESGPVSLPFTLKGLSARMPVVLTARIQPGPGECIYLKTVYAPVRVYMDGELVFTYGEEGDWPSFLPDPPTMVKLVPALQTSRPVTLRLEFLFPSHRNQLPIQPVVLGTSDQILQMLFSEMGFSLFFSIVLIALGILLALISIVLLRFEKTGISVLWLGLFSFLTGMWVLGECDLTGMFIDNPTILYLMAFMGLFTFSVPLLKLGETILNLHRPEPVRWMYTGIEFAVFCAVLLQLTGVCALSKIMYLFHVLIPLALCVFAGTVFWEAVRYKNRFATHFLLSAIVLAVFSLLEVANYYLFHFHVQITFFFQVGVLLFVVLVCIQCGNFLRYSFLMQARNRKLSYELSLMEKQMEAQKKRYSILYEMAASIKIQRHDLKHQLAVIRNYHENRQAEKLTDYLDSLSANIPMEDTEPLCRNEAVNAVALYYQGLAKKAGISRIWFYLDIPSDSGRVSDSDLCIIVGNLLENAIAACGILDGRTSFIRMKSHIQYDILVITMDNAYQSVKQKPDGTFVSQKAGGGVGLASIISVAEKYGGNARFEAQNQVFSSSVYLHLK
ncbi:MAG: GHKL domain-containing protein [Lachnospiraceae bacterium]|nr:GHKL domain-containing protein [Lachnospiraceae bacterium]